MAGLISAVRAREQDRFGREIPWWLRLIGCWAIQASTPKNIYRFSWGEFVPSWGLALSYSVYHENADVHIHLVFGSVFIKAPMLIMQRPGTEDWDASYGFTYFERALQFKWRTRCKIVHMPWDWQHVRHDYLWPDGSLALREDNRPVRLGGPGFQRPPPTSRRVFPYRYVRRNGDIQHRWATVNGEEREWRWRWFTWLSWPQRVERTINVEFDKEVGEGVDTWKGGVIGCGYDWRHGESLLDALRRMERERRFGR